MIRDLAILYRGPLSSCNYGCPYCPFAKHFETAEELETDTAALTRFTLWAEEQSRLRLSILFTPWGEALIRKWYQQAMMFLSRLPNVEKVAIQTNLSCPLDWIDGADKQKLALWATYHPGEVSRDRFLAKCRQLSAAGVRFSAGVVGMMEHRAEIEALRKGLPEDVYLWINAYKPDRAYYTAEMVESLTGVDPYFPFNMIHHESAGRLCDAGHRVISVDGAGTVRRCHFVKTVIGNVYDPGFAEKLSAAPSPCPNPTCGCHIGYIHMPHLGQQEIYGKGLLERVPTKWPI